MNDARKPARWMSTPMIKGKLLEVLKQVAPQKRWPKNARLKDLIEFTLSSVTSDTTDSLEMRALELAHVIHDSERR